jgi:hypothetical protein
VFWHDLVSLDRWCGGGGDRVVMVLQPRLAVASCTSTQW